MLRTRWLPVMCLAVLCCATVRAQESPSQLPDAPQQQPQAQPPAAEPAPPPDDSKKEDKKQDSKIKRTLKRGAPNCMKIGGVEKCWPAPGEPPDGEVKGDDEKAKPPSQAPDNEPLPRSANPDESSSKVPLEGLGLPGANADVQELHPYNPHKADKDVEVGDFYYKRGNYRAAESRYAEALQSMPNHADATYKLADTQEKLGKKMQARENYEKYLKILPTGPLAEPARKALARLGTQAKDATSPPAEKRP